MEKPSNLTIVDIFWPLHNKTFSLKSLKDAFERQYSDYFYWFHSGYSGNDIFDFLCEKGWIVKTNQKDTYCFKIPEKDRQLNFRFE